MLNVWDVFMNALWIVGLAMVLAVWSYARYTAREAGVRLRDKLDILEYTLVLNCGLLMFMVGMALTDNRWYTKILWILLSIIVLVVSGVRIKQFKSGNTELNGQD